MARDERLRRRFAGGQALITGGSAGIGAAAARRFLEVGGVASRWSRDGCTRPHAAWSATVDDMADLQPRPGRVPSRRQREQRAFLAAVVGGVAGAVALVGFVLAIFGVIGGGVPLLALIVAVVCLWLFRRTVRP